MSIPLISVLRSFIPTNLLPQTFVLLLILGLLAENVLSQTTLQTKSLSVPGNVDSVISKNEEATVWVHIEMKRSDFHQIVQRESLNELSMLEKDKDRVWKHKSKRYFKSGRSCQFRLFDTYCAMPFLVCDSTPGLSGFKRMNIIRKRVFDETPPGVQHLVGFGNIPMYNGDDRTCYASTMTPKTARKLANGEYLEDSTFVIQSFVPMMKVSYGAVNFINDSVDNNVSSLSIIAELSPHYRDKRNQILLDKIVELSVKSGQMRKKCRQQLYDSFPSTGKKYDSCQKLSYESDVSASWLTDSIMIFSISLSNDTTLEQSKEKALRFVASLALRPEILSLEVIESYRYIV